MSLMRLDTQAGPEKRWRAMLAAGAALVVLLWAASAWASTVLKLDLESLVANSEQIVDGRVASVSTKVEHGKVYTYTEVEVQEDLKGVGEAATVTIKQLGGRTETLATWVPGVPHFTSGERVIVFLEKQTPEDYPVVTGMSQGKFKIAVGPDNLTPYVVPYLGNLGLIEPTQLQGELPQGDLPQNNLPSADANTTRESPQTQGNYQPAKPADLYERVVPLDVFKQQVREVIRGQQGD